MGRYVEKWSHGVLDTLQDELKCVSDRVNGGSAFKGILMDMAHQWCVDTGW